MCLIIQRPANAALDFEDFKVAMLNNPDGWGMSAALGPDNKGRGRLKTYRNHNKADPEKLYRFVQEEHKEVPILLHLRYTTAGETNLRNAHPFPILEKEVDGVDLRMAHNGTLHDYKTKTWESDTRNFVRSYVRPFFKRLVAFTGPEDVLKDRWSEWVLDGELSMQSVLSFIDGYGNTLEVNGEGNGGGRGDDKVYFSNKYSFDPEHRIPKDWWKQPGYGYNGAAYSSPKPAAQSNKVITKPTIVKDHAKDTMTKKFSEEHNLTDFLEDVLDLSDDAIDAICQEPEDAALLIKELICELFQMQQEKEFG